MKFGWKTVDLENKQERTAGEQAAIQSPRLTQRLWGFEQNKIANYKVTTQLKNMWLSPKINHHFIYRCWKFHVEIMVSLHVIFQQSF